MGACQRGQSSTPLITSVTGTPITKQTVTAIPSVPLYPAPTAVQFVTITPGAYPQPSSQAQATPTKMPYPPPSTVVTSPTTAVSSPTVNPNLFVTLTPNQTQNAAASVSPTQVPPSPTNIHTSVPQYPGPGIIPTITQKYPGPIITNTPIPYPGPATATRGPTRTPSKSATAAPSQSGTVPPFPSPTMQTGTPGASPTELPPKPALSPPPPGSSVVIWHSWGNAETTALQSIIQSFQRIYPDVTFSLQYVPLDDLYDKYEAAAYAGSGPSLLLGPASWGPGLFEEELVTDLNPYVPADFLSTINPAALGSGQYQQSLISLALSQHGMVMFRNTSIITDTLQTFEELNSSSHQVTRSGIVGSYLERGSQFSAAGIIGLGGSLMGEDGYPAFNSQFGLEWFNLLADYDAAGAVTFNTNWDLDMFRRGRVGIILDGTWNLSQLTQIIGTDNLAIDPWPTYGTGHMSGWVESDSVFLNPTTTGDNRSAALAFMGYLLDPNVQMHMAEVGHIPSVIRTQPRDPLIQQAMIAFSKGATYPINVDQSVLKLYQTELDKAIQNVFVNGAAPGDALKSASDNIVIQLKSLQNVP
jgi:ABC-type glycerol-3-phosphate transport system substrate-binding protein